MIKIFKGSDVNPLVYLTPRGLITVLLFFAIPAEFLSADFNPGILLFTIIATSLIMTSALISYGNANNIEDPVGNLGDELEMYEEGGFVQTDLPSSASHGAEGDV